MFTAWDRLKQSLLQQGTSYAVADELLARICTVDQNVQSTFRAFDTDGNGIRLGSRWKFRFTFLSSTGWISKREMKDRLKKLGIVDALGCASRDFAALWHSLDSNGDGRVNW